MIEWFFALAFVTVLSYLSDVGILSFFQNLKVPFFNASILSILILFCMLGVLVRLLYMPKKGGKEILRKRINELEKQVKTPQ